MTQDKKLTVAQEKFIYELIKGTTQSEAYMIAYPTTRKWQPQSVHVAASKLMAQPHIQTHYNKLLEEFRAREKEKTGWTREQSIETLRFVIDANKKDIERINQAAEDELIFLQEQLKANTDPVVICKLIEKMLNKRKQVRANMTNNTALISATSELNKMQGFNEQNVNLNGTVVFQDEEELEE